MRLYVDDTVVYNSGDSIIQTGLLLQTSLNLLYDWCNTNKLTVNINKSKVMTFGSRSVLSNILLSILAW